MGVFWFFGQNRNSNEGYKLLLNIFLVGGDIGKKENLKHTCLLVTIKQNILKN